MGNKDIDGSDYTGTRSADYSRGASEGTNAWEYSIPTANDTKETEYQCNWIKWLGYYKSLPELQSMIDKLSIWTVGKGFKATKGAKDVEKIRGTGKDTFNTIIFNQHRTERICGDSFAEIIKTKRGELRNLKSLNPGSIKIYADDYGMIKKYEQIIEGKVVASFAPEEMFHLSNNKIADAIHGTSTLEKLQEMIESRKEGTRDLRVVFHRYVKPLWIFSVDTDDTTEIAAFKLKIDKTIELSENLIVPKDTVNNIERVSIPQYSTLDPLPWLKHVHKYFTMSEGVPQIIMGDAEDATEAAAKVLYLAFQQMIEWEQMYLSEQIKIQLGVEGEFEFPASIEPEMQQDEKKDSNLNGKGEGGMKA